jgi:hypothetical protein
MEGMRDEHQYINGVEIKNMRLVGHTNLGGRGNGGEGIGLQKTKDGRRIMYIAHECYPVNFSVVDVTDPSKPNLLMQTELPHNEVRSNSLDLVGDILAVAYQTQKPGRKPARAMELFDVQSDQSSLHLVLRPLRSTLARAHYVGFMDGEYMHIGSGARTSPAHLKDHQF